MPLQAVQLLGVKADDLAPLKEAAEKDDLEALLKRCQFTQWVMRVQTRTRRAPRCPSPLEHLPFATYQLDSVCMAT